MMCRLRTRGFTILEMMISILMFALVLAAIYTIWIAILKGTQVSQAAAASVQRSRIAMHALEDALVTAQVFVANRDRWYSFLGDQQGMEMTSRLPATFPGVGAYGDQIVRRVIFELQPGKDGMEELVMTQYPLLLDISDSGVKPYTIVLAKDVSVFELQYWDMQKRDWVEEWTGQLTNSLPKLVAVTLGMGKVPGSSRPQDVVARIVSLPANAVMPDIQGSLMPGARPGMTNRP